MASRLLDERYGLRLTFYADNGNRYDGFFVQQDDDSVCSLITFEPDFLQDDNLFAFLKIPFVQVMVHDFNMPCANPNKITDMLGDVFLDNASLNKYLRTIISPIPHDIKSSVRVEREHQFIDVNVSLDNKYQYAVDILIREVLKVCGIFAITTVNYYPMPQ